MTRSTATRDTPKRNAALAALLAGFLRFAVSADAADWNQWRGPDRNGVSPETELLARWDVTTPAQLWEIPLGEGFSGIAVVGNRLVTMAGQGDDEFVLCLNADNGDELWRYRIDRLFTEGHGNGPRSTPTVHGGQVFALSAWGTLAALNLTDGGELWKRQLRHEFGGKETAIEPWRGYAGSPLIDGGLLLVEIAGTKNRTVAAFRPENGEIAWTSLGDRPSYSSPIAMTIGGVRPIVWFNGQGLVGVALTDGAELWRYPFETSFDQNISSPVFVPPDRVFISEGYDGKGGVLVRIESRGEGFAASEAWKSPQMRCDFASAVNYQGFLYGFDNASLKCLDAADGSERWLKRGFGRGTLIVADGHLIVLGERGQLAVAEAVPDEYRETGFIEKVLNGKCWTVPTLSDGRLYVRDERALVCLDLRGRTATK